MPGFVATPELGAGLVKVAVPDIGLPPLLVPLYWTETETPPGNPLVDQYATEHNVQNPPLES